MKKTIPIKLLISSVIVFTLFSVLESSLAFASDKIEVLAEHTNPLAKGMDSIISYGSKGIGIEQKAAFMYVGLRCRGTNGTYYTCPRNFGKQMRFLFKEISWDSKNNRYFIELDRTKFPKTYFSSLAQNDPRQKSTTLKVILGSPKSATRPNEKFKSTKGVTLSVSNNRSQQKVESKIVIDLKKISSSYILAGVAKTQPNNPKPWPPVKRPPWELNVFNSPVQKSGHIGQIRFR